jgi:molybdopterin synthase catalytic subunit
VIEEIKKRLPVWKHERYADGDAHWVSGTDPRGGAVTVRREGSGA